MRFFKDKTALITGASSGLGADFARQLAAEGCNLVLVARRLERLQNLKREILDQHDVQISLYSMDLSDAHAADDLYGATEARGLVIDLLINNAGFGLAGDFLDLDAERELEMLTLNIITPTRLSKLYGRHMASVGHGHILLVASVVAFQPTPTLSTYAASKAYIQSFGEAIAYEFRAYGVGVTVLSPGGVATEFSDVAGQQLSALHQGALMQSTEVVAAALNGLEHGEARVVPGVMNQVSALASRFMPRRLAPRIADWILRSTIEK